jgi:hypothetical protein
MAFDIEMIREVYKALPSKIELTRKLLNRPLTLTEKILYSHLFGDLPSQPFAGCHSTNGVASIHDCGKKHDCCSFDCSL